MLTEDIWQRAVGLTNRILKLTSGLALPRGDYWPTLVTVSLAQANARLHSTELLLNEGDCDSAVILTRSLFELEVNLSYISKDVKKRLPKYLRHGGIPLTEGEVEQVKAQLESGRTDVKDIVPKRAWKPLKEMCCDLGYDRLKEYETFFPYASVPTHAGAFTLGKTLMLLLTGRSPTDQERAEILVTASEFHLRVAQIAAETFPEHITIKTIEALRKECSMLGKSLLQDQ